MNSQTILMLVTSTSKTRAELNVERLRELENKLRFGTNGGLSGFDDSPVKRVCPGYNIN